MNIALEKIRSATAGSDFEGKLYLVGGVVRDQIMGVPEQEDVDLVVEGDALKLAQFLHRKRISEHPPVIYRRFGTAMLTIGGQHIEIVTARSESYERSSRKPDVQPATLLEDALRRDFTINALLRNLHTGEVLDLTGKGISDIERKVIRTPLDPTRTFDEDPLRMLRAVRFAARFGFEIEPETYRALSTCADRLAIISKERIRDEFTKILVGPDPTLGLEMMLETGLLAQFAPELATMTGCEQNKYHIYNCWTHTMKTVQALPTNADLTLCLAALFHDVGKPETKTFEENGDAHFYGHEHVGAAIAARVMRRLRFSNDQVEIVRGLIDLHLRPGAYHENWTDTAVRRLMREAGPLLDDLLTLSKADSSASNPELIHPDYAALETRIAAVKAELCIEQIRSPLDGKEIMRLLGIKPGPKVKEIKEFLLDEILEGRLKPDDIDTAREIALRHFGGNTEPSS